MPTLPAMMVFAESVFGVESEVCWAGEAWLCVVVETESGGVRWKCGEDVEEIRRFYTVRRLRSKPLPTKNSRNCRKQEHFKESNTK